MVGYAGSPICIVHAHMTVTRSKVKVNVTELLASEVPKIALFYVYLQRHFGVKLKTDG